MIPEGNPHQCNGDAANKKAELNPRRVETERRVVALRWRSAGGTPPRNARAPPRTQDKRNVHRRCAVRTHTRVTPGPSRKDVGQKSSGRLDDNVAFTNPSG